MSRDLERPLVFHRLLLCKWTLLRQETYDHS